MSAPKFAALCGVKYQTLTSWLARRKGSRQPARKAPARVRWLEASVQPAAAAAGSGLLLQLPGGVRAELASQQHVQLAAALVRALEKPC